MPATRAVADTIAEAENVAVTDIRTQPKTMIVEALEAISIAVVGVPGPEPFLLTVIGTTVLPDEIAVIEMTEKTIGNETVNGIETEIEIGNDTVLVRETDIMIALRNPEARAHSSMRMNVIVALCLFSNLLHV